MLHFTDRRSLRLSPKRRLHRKLFGPGSITIQY